MIESDKETFLGFDLSTQKLKAVQLNHKLEVLAHAEVKFDIDLPEFNTEGGVNHNLDTNEFYVRPSMWIKAIDIVLDRLVVQGAKLNTVACISGSAQQHGSLYWSPNGIEILENLDPDQFLHKQLTDDVAFTIDRTPIWMDGTTERQCSEMEEAVGGRDRMVDITGSKCYARFTGPQIRKIFQHKPDAYDRTSRISLVSSFLASIFIGKIAPIDLSDGSGMNLLDIRSKYWSAECLNGCAPGLEGRLGCPIPTTKLIGKIAPFFVQRYLFNSGCQVAAFTGDNPSALTGMLVGENWLAISLGTSDTIMMGIQEPVKKEEGHILVHPTEGGYMGLLCFRNGSLVRDIFNQTESNNNWEHFSELLDSTPRGNAGNIALHFPQVEIIPRIQGSLRWNTYSNSNTTESAQGVQNFSTAATEIRALVEGQMLHRKMIATGMGFSFAENTRILITGGASANKSILRVISDVFTAPVYIQKSTEAALLGSAFRALYTLYLDRLPIETTPESYFDYVSERLPMHMEHVCDPAKDSKEIYDAMTPRYREMISVLSATFEQSEKTNADK